MKNVFTFITGVALGSLVTWGILKERYKKIADEEIRSVKDTFKEKKSNVSDEDEGYRPTLEDLEELKKQLETNAYTNYSGGEKPKEKEKEKEDDEMEPYVIAPEEYDENGYKTMSLTFWSDGVVTDEANFPIDDIEETIGEDSLTHFGEYEDDSVFVRNDRLRTDYEILMDARKFADVYPDRDMEG